MRMAHWLIMTGLLFYIIILIPTISSYSSGPPETPEICSTLTPSHGSTDFTDTAAKFQIDIDDLNEGLVTVTIHSSKKFKGIF